jgi:hypothetical protein
MPDPHSTASSPKRIQRSRTKGWRMPKNAVYVGRPTIFGNPFPDAATFQRWIAGALGTGGGGLRRLHLFAHLHKIRGKDLACWCPLNKPCHADVLLEIANADKAAR